MQKKEIIYGIGFNVNKAGLKELKTELQRIQNFTEQDFLSFNPDLAKKNFQDVKSELSKIKNAATDLEFALERSFNPKLGTVNIQKFRQELDKTNTKSISRAATELAKVGDTGIRAFSAITTQLLTTKRELKQTYSIIDKLGETLTNTVRWKIASSAIDLISGSIRNAWNYSKRLDSSLNDIRIVTGKSADEMERFAKIANKAAKGLGASTTNYTNAALIYYQQGLAEQDVQARTNVTVKAANVTGQSASEVSEQLTAVWNGYKVVAEEAELYVDKLAAVAASTAADLEELSNGMSKVASAAHTMGVDVDQLSAQLSTIISVTRQDASVVGTALKTIYARMGDLKVSGVDEFGTSLGDVSGQLKQMGIDVLDQNGNLRDMGNVIEEVAQKWGTWTDAQQQAAAVAIAGKRQYNNLIALFENWDMYESAKGTSENSIGTLQKQQDIYLDSTEAHLKELTTAAEKFYDALINNESVNILIDHLTILVELASTFTNALGGAGNMLGLLGPIFASSIGKTLGGFNASLAVNRKNKIYNKSEEEERNIVIGDLAKIGISFSQQDEEEKAALEEIIKLKKQQAKYSQVMTEEELNNSDARIAAIATEKRAIQDLKNELQFKKSTLFDLTSIEQNSEALQEAKIDINNFGTFSQNLKNFKTNNQSILRDLDLDSTKSKNKRKIDKANKKIISSFFDLNGDGIVKNLQDQLNKNSSLQFEEKENLQNLLTSYNKTNATYKEKLNILSQLESATKKYNKALDEHQKEIDEMNQKITLSKDAYDRLNKEMADEEYAKTIAARTQQIAQVTGAIMGVVGALNTVINLTNVWSDDTLTTGEKITQTIMGVVTIFGVVTTIVPVFMDVFNIKLKQTDIQAKKTWASVLGPLAPIYIAITAIISILGILAGVLKKIDISSPAEKARKEWEKINGSLEENKKFVTQLQNDYAKLKDEINDFRNVKLVLDDMAIGTKEWKAQVAELNSQVFDLIEKYPLLSDYLDSESINGLTVYDIKEEGLNTLVSSQNKAIQQARLSSAGLALAAKEKEIDVLRQNSKENYNSIIQERDGSYYYEKGKSYLNSVSKEDANEILEKLEKYVTIDSTGSTKQITLNTEAIESLDSFSLEQIIQKFNENEFDDDLHVLEYIKAVKNNTKVQEDLTEASDKLKEAYLKTIADDNKVDSEIFTLLTKNKEVITPATEADFKGTKFLYSISKDNIDEQGKWIKTQEKKWEVGKVVDAQYDDVNQIRDWFTNLAQAAGYKDIKIGNIKNGDSVENVAYNTDLVLDGVKMTSGDLIRQLNQIEADRQNEILYNEVLAETKKLSNAGRLESAALFAEGLYDENKVKEYGKLSLSDYSTIIGYGGTYKTNAENSLTNFKERIKQYLKDGPISATDDSTGEIKNIFSRMTENEIKSFSTAIKTADRIDGTEKYFKNLIDGITDPDQMREVASLISGTDFLSVESIKKLQSGLIETGITLDENFTKFFNNLTSGYKQWISNNEKVKESLLLIKDTIESIEAGEIISEEDYNKIIEIEPTLAKYFAITAGGRVALASGSEMGKIAKGQFSNLGQIKTYYKGIRTAVGTQRGSLTLGEDSFLTGQNFKDYFGLDEKNNEITEDQAKSLANIAVALGLPGYTDLNTSTSYIQDLVKKAIAGDVSAQEELKNLLLKINQAKLDVEHGNYSNSASEQTYATTVAGSWSEVIGPDNKDNISSWDKEAFEKSKTYWANYYLKQLGFSLDKSIVDDLTSEQVTELESAVVKLRKLELDYLKNLNAEASKLQTKGELLIGQNKLVNLNDLVTNAKGAEAEARSNLNLANSRFETVYMNDGYEGYVENGRLNIVSVNDALAALDPKNPEHKAQIESLNGLLAAWDAVLDGEQKAAEAINKVLDAQIEAFKYQYEYQKQLNELLKEFNNFTKEFEDWTSKGLKVFEDKTIFDKVASSLSSMEYLSKDYQLVFGELLEIFQTNEEGSIFTNLGQFTYSSDYDYAAYKEYTETTLKDAQSILQSMKEELQSLYDSYLEAQDQILELYDKELDKISKINSILKGSADLSKLIGGNTSYYYDRIAQFGADQMDLVKAQYNAAVSEYEKVKNAASATDEMIEKAQNNMVAAAENIISTSQEAWDAIAESFNETLTETFNAFVGGEGLDGLSEEWEMLLSRDEDYLDRINATYEVNKLDREIAKSIDESSNAAAQQKLIELRATQEERLNSILKERGKLSQYELDRARAEYDLTLKQIALEEAQRSASKMKLVRDSMGNYTYQYISDEDQIAKAEEELAAAQNNLYNIDKDRTQSLVSNYYSTMMEANSLIAEAIAEGDEERIARLEEHFLGPNGILTEIQRELVASESFLDENWEDKFQSFTDAIKNAKLGDLTDSVKDLISETQEDMNKVETEINALLKEDGVLDSIVKNVEDTVQSVKDIAPEVDKLQNATLIILDDLPTLVKNVGNLAEELGNYSSAYTDWLNTNKPNEQALLANTAAITGLTNAVTNASEKLNGKTENGDQSGGGSEQLDQQ